MSFSKPTLNKIFTANSSVISTIMTNFKSLLDSHQSYPLKSSLVMMLLSLILFISITFWMLVTFVSSFLLLIEAIFMKSLGMFSHTGIPGWNIHYTLSRWLKVMNDIPATYKKWRKSELTEDSDLHPDFTSHYSEMPGGLDEVSKYNRGIVTEEQFENVRKKV